MVLLIIILLFLLAGAVLAVWLLRKSQLILAIPLSIVAPQLAIYVFIQLEALVRQSAESTAAGAPMAEVAQFTLGIPASLVCLGLLVIFRKLSRK